MSKLVLHKNKKFKIANIQDSICNVNYILFVGYEPIFDVDWEVADFRYIQNDLQCLLFTPKGVIELSYFRNDNNFVILKDESSCLMHDKLYVKNVFSPLTETYNQLLTSAHQYNNKISDLVSHFLSYYKNRKSLNIINFDKQMFMKEYKYNDIAFSDRSNINGVEILNIIQSIAKK